LTNDAIKAFPYFPIKLLNLFGYKINFGGIENEVLFELLMESVADIK